MGIVFLSNIPILAMAPFLPEIPRPCIMGSRGTLIAEQKEC
jgi:hypothetical protein